MPRYYIDVRSYFGTDEDPTGIDLPNLAAARDEALKVVAGLMETWAGVKPAYSGEIAIEIVGEDLRPILIIPFSDLSNIPQK
ncbi:DUF6894 family protein [Microvirga rosea]|uniref:DUF6894 family protein n=1 Tax=Microvirga rosea TaxID=2715425 RepID=UPI001D0A1488|nr:hypothetical protein [Microvirga rosea]MCB8822197.1 hypothetical protein [Microvirga rosea]